MPWLTTCTDTNKIETTGGPWIEKRPVLSGSSGIGGIADVKEYRRTHTPVTTEYVGIDYATAVDFATDAIEDDGVMSARYDRDGEGGAYRVIIESETIGEWALYPPETTP